jgi:predicted Zn-dependent protease
MGLGVMWWSRRTHRRLAGATVVIGLGVLLSGGALGGQTVVTPPDNKYTPAQDVELGRQAAVEVERQLPLLRDAEVTSFVASLGTRLVQSIPEALRHSEFQYSFQPRHDRGGGLSR